MSDHYIVICDCGRVVTQCPCQEPEILKTGFPGKCPACDPRPFRERVGERWEEGASPCELYAWQMEQGDGV